MDRTLLAFFVIAPLPLTAQFLSADFDPGGQNDLIWEIDTTPGNLWQVGPPQKGFFNSAHSSPNVMVTDTLNTYPVNSASAFTIKAPLQDFTWGPVFFLSFYQAFDTDSLQEGGHVEVSWDHGTTWINIYEDWMMPLNIEFYDPQWNPLQADTLANGQIGFSGRSGSVTNGVDWCFTSFCWTNTGIPPVDTMYLRFIFQSDSIAEARDGWMLDDFHFESYIAHPVSEHERDRDYFKMAPNPMRDRTHILFDLTEPSNSVHLALFDSQGRTVRVLRDGILPPGNEVVTLWRDALGLNEGLYHVVGEINGRREQQKLLVAGDGAWSWGAH